MASSKNKLSEEQLQEGVFQKILQHIVGGRIDFVFNAFKENKK